MDWVERGSEPSPAVPDQAGPGLVRPRLTLLLADPDAFRVALIVAPAGSGKSTLAAHVARAHPGPVAWCEPADAVPRSESTLVAWLWAAIGPVLVTEAASPDSRAPASIDELVRAVGSSEEVVLVVADDVHLMEASDAEAALARLASRVPPTMRLLLASRVNLHLDLSRVRVSGQLVEIVADDLRFRTWEVEQLFTAVYHEPMPPEDMAALTRRTAGWAAYLQLFHLATSRKTASQRRQVLASMANPTRQVQEYLARHVLADLSEELRDFLIRTSVLRRPTGQLCDELLDRTGSDQLLAELERRQVFTDRVEMDDSYRYHTVLLSYLDGRLVDAIGVEAARQEHHRAAVLLEGVGFVEDSVAAYVKSEDWAGVERLLGHLGSTPGALGGSWLEVIPQTTIAGDPWLLMVRARRELGRGSLRDAALTLADAESVTVSSTVAEQCRRQRNQIGAWLSADLSTGDDWLALARLATQRSPGKARQRAAGLPGVNGRFAEGLAALLAGDPRATGRLMRAVVDHPDVTAVVAASAQVALLFAEGIGLAERPDELARLRDGIDAADVPWLDRVVRAFLSLGQSDGGDTDDLRRACLVDGDRWGEALVALFAGLAGLVTGAPLVAPLEDAVVVFGELGAGVLEMWSECALAAALVRVGDTARGVAAAGHARTLAGIREVPAAGALAALVLGMAAPDNRQLAWAEETLEPLGLWHPFGVLAGWSDEEDDNVLALPLGSVNGNGPPPSAGGETSLRCFGGFSLVLEGRAVNEAAAKPMERAILHVLAMEAGQATHREQLVEMLWPGAEPDAGRHRLQVAISALRRLLDGGGDGDRARYLVREGDSYRLALPPDADVDVWRLRERSQVAAVARSVADVGAEKQALIEVLAAYRGPLLPGDGPAEWVIGPRTLAQSTAAAAAARLSSLLLEAGDTEGAAGAARTGLEIDRFRDDLWRLSMTIAERAGHHADAERLRQAYDALLGDMGVGPPGR